MEQKDGVHITLREIYDTLQLIGSDVKGLESKFKSLELQGEEIKMLERQVENNKEAISEVKNIAERAKELSNKHEQNISWLWKTMIGAFLVAFTTAVIGVLFSLFQNALIDNKTNNDANEEDGALAAYETYAARPNYDQIIALKLKEENLND